MEHARADYARLQDPENKIPADEPVFLIRGQDKVGWAVVALWAILAWLVGASQKHVSLALEQSVKMFKWPLKKVPDLPQE